MGMRQTTATKQEKPLSGFQYLKFCGRRVGFYIILLGDKDSRSKRRRWELDLGFFGFFHTILFRCSVFFFLIE